MKELKYRVGVLFGGRSSEHEVSLASAQNVMSALRQAGHQVLPIGVTRSGEWLFGDDPMEQLQSAVRQISDPMSNLSERETTLANTPTEQGWTLMAPEAETIPRIDIVFPVLHGPYGEDGTIQGLLEMLNLPYVGCGVLASAVAMDKVIAKKLFFAEGIPQTQFQVVMREQWQKDGENTLRYIEETLAYPLFVKPANLGSSIGVSKAENPKELFEAIETAVRYDRKILVEEAVPHARELEVSVLGICHAENHQPKVSVPGEIRPSREFYDYTAKYSDDSSELMIPAPLEPEQVREVQDLALRAFYAIDGSGPARVDFLLNDRTGALYLNEINTMPGFTRISMYPKLWEASGMSYPELVDRLVQLALARYEDRQRNACTRN